MTITETPLKDCFVIEPRVFEDDRGYFFESYNAQRAEGTVLEQYNWVQENESKSDKGVLRGLHFQKGEHAQSKLVRVIVGEVFDVAVDMRQDSETFGQWYGLMLTAKNKRQFLVPRGFAHGFLVVSDTAIFQYKCDNWYAPAHDSGVMFNDAQLAIEWPKLDIPFLLSAKDQKLDSFSDAYKF